MSDTAPPQPSRGDLASEYFDQLPFEPYRVQEDALLAWFDEGEGILVCAPTGTGKTLIAEAAVFEALRTRQTAYYTTPLIALTEQKFQELQAAAVRWGFSADDVGLVTGHRRVNPQAPVLVVVAEILLNRLVHPDGFDFSNVSAVVMDEFHSFNDPERGAVWELSLAMLPRHVRLMLLSATVGNAVDFLLWLRREHGRKVQLIQGTERKVPLEFQWVGEELLPDFVEQMHDGTDETRRTPALVFCFNREECWSVAEQLKGKNLLRSGQQKELAVRLDEWSWKIGAGPKLKQLLMRGVGVHHAGVLPKYRRRVETLFQEKLLSVCVCTETLAAGINLPARSVVLTTLVKGPPGKKLIVDPSSAHQMFGRAGRPQFDTHGYVFAMAHEDDVKIARWKQQYDQIPEDTKDPNLIRMKKKLKKKMPTRRKNESYWNEEQFQKLIASPPGNLMSRGQLPWRLVAYLLQISPEVNRLVRFIHKRLLPPKQMEKVDQDLSRMLRTLATGEFVQLEPPPEEPIIPARRDWPIPEPETTEPPAVEEPASDDFASDLELEESSTEDSPPESSSREAKHKKANEPDSSDDESPSESMGTLGSLLQAALSGGDSDASKPLGSKPLSARPDAPAAREVYLPERAVPTWRLENLMLFRTCHPLYASFLMDHLGIANREERIQLLESVLEVPGSIQHLVRVPPPDRLPRGPLATYRIDPELLSRGLITPAELDPSSAEPELDPFGRPIRQFAVPLADRMKRLFDFEYPGVQDVRIRAVWIVGDQLQVGDDFHKYVTTRNLTKQEGVIFRHFLRMMLLCEEFLQLTPAGTSREEWSSELKSIQSSLSDICHAVDPESTDKILESLHDQDALREPI